VQRAKNDSDMCWIFINTEAKIIQSNSVASKLTIREANSLAKLSHTVGGHSPPCPFDLNAFELQV